jgi:glycosyltransferase involved in cell wall biosynthesis
VQFFDYQPKAELAESLSAADLHLVVLQPHIRQFLMPSKFYGALASGTAVLAITSEDCELAEIVLRHNLGRVVTGHTVDELVDAIRAMADEPEQLAIQSANARSFAESRCTREESARRIAELFWKLRDIGGEPAGVALPTEATATVR